jgi:hypothetical protein
MLQPARRTFLPLLPVRAIFGISCLLLGVALLACRMESSADVAEPYVASEERWVRTAVGWERPDSWYLEPVGPRRLHPLVVAAGQGLVSVLGLVVFGRDEE